ncbi:MAG: hypothetical protein Q8P41_12810 [Pseudomonadota bacterium]|nr:hypothetical protein [Pseudomonadota bacterium]
MINIRAVVAGFPIAVARAALYYASRYFKQASYFEKYDKDIFEDDGLYSDPSEDVRQLALRVIQCIESAEGRRATELDDETALRLLDDIIEVEQELDPEADEETRARALESMRSMEAPSVRVPKRSSPT